MHVDVVGMAAPGRHVRPSFLVQASVQLSSGFPSTQRLLKTAAGHPCRGLVTLRVTIMFRVWTVQYKSTSP